MKLGTKCKVRLNIVISISIEMLHLDFKWRVHAKKRPSNIFHLKKFQSIPKNFSCCQRLLSNDARRAKEVIFTDDSISFRRNGCIWIFHSWILYQLIFLLTKVSLSIKHTLSVSVGAFSKRIKYLLHPNQGRAAGWSYRDENLDGATEILYFFLFL